MLASLNDEEVGFLNDFDIPYVIVKGAKYPKLKKKKIIRRSVSGEEGSEDDDEDEENEDEDEDDDDENEDKDDEDDEDKDEDSEKEEPE